jgi:hypothetical protein
MFNRENTASLEAKARTFNNDGPGKDQGTQCQCQHDEGFSASHYDANAAYDH